MPTRTLLTRVAGVSFEGRQALVNLIADDTPLRAVCEGDNPYDKFAVAVEANLDDDWLKIGYVPKVLSEYVHLHMPSHSVPVKVRDFTGGRREDGVTIPRGIVIELTLEE